jgi:elongator complex protein 3
MQIAAVDHQTAIAVLEQIQAAPRFDSAVYNHIYRAALRAGALPFTKQALAGSYHELVAQGIFEPDAELERRLQTKPIRTLSGVAPVAVLTKPYPCPGDCIFCPDDSRAPKSYLASEPGASRALMLDFDPYRQTRRRIEAFGANGHWAEKVELLILGGSWTAYPRDYQAWFVRRCMDAMNGQDSETLEEAHTCNESASHRNVGLTIETRPDHITPGEAHWLRRLGVTRVQLGVQSLDDAVLARNRRGHTVEDVRRAVRLLRGAGFKLTLHWMPNLLGATPESDLADYERLWADPALRPDELKIYPTSLLPNTGLYEEYRRGKYRPYSEDELIDLLMACKQITPPYCRINRVMRDIPAPEIVDGVRRSNLREDVLLRMRMAETPCRCVRCREVRGRSIDSDALQLDKLVYGTDHRREVFLSAVTQADQLAGFVRLSLPTASPPITELEGHAIIRQLQVYGPALALGVDEPGPAQHQGVGTWLLEEAKQTACEAGYGALAVIAAVGTRDYYRQRGFRMGELYMSMAL